MSLVDYRHIRHKIAPEVGNLRVALENINHFSSDQIIKIMGPSISKLEKVVKKLNESEQELEGNEYENNEQQKEEKNEKNN